LSTAAAVGIAIQVRQLLRGAQAQDVTASDLVRIPPHLTLQDAVDRCFMRYDHGSFPVDEYGRTIGLLTLRKVRRVPGDQWPARGYGITWSRSAARSWYRRMSLWTRSWPGSRTARPGGCLRPTMGRWWGSSRHRISPGGCAVGERSTAERSTADRTAGTWTGGTEVDCFTHYGLGGFPAGLWQSRSGHRPATVSTGPRRIQRTGLLGPGHQERPVR